MLKKDKISYEDFKQLVKYKLMFISDLLANIDSATEQEKQDYYSTIKNTAGSLMYTLETSSLDLTDTTTQNTIDNGTNNSASNE